MPKQYPIYVVKSFEAYGRMGSATVAADNIHDALTILQRGLAPRNGVNIEMNFRLRNHLEETEYRSNRKGIISLDY